MYGNFVHATNDASHYTKPPTNYMALYCCIDEWSLRDSAEAGSTVHGATCGTDHHPLTTRDDHTA